VVGSRVAFPGQEIYPGQEKNPQAQDQPHAGAERALRHLSDALQGRGWRVASPQSRGADLVVSKGKHQFLVEFRFAREPRRQMLRALLADAILSGRAHAGNRRRFIAVLGAPSLSPSMEQALDSYAAEVAPGQAVGYVDDCGFVRLLVPGIEDIRREPEAARGERPPKGQPRDPFSDLNQWMLKVLVGRLLPEKVSVPAARIRSAADLAKAAGASVPAAWRLWSGLKAEGHLGSSGDVVRVPELFARWRAAARRPQHELKAVWILPGRSPVERLRRELADAAQEGPPSACLGLFAACDALGVGHVRGAPVHLYVRKPNPELLEKLGLVVAEPGRSADVVVRVARWPESVFRATVRVDGVPAADVIQCWLDVSSHPARGQEQAAFIWKRVLALALAPGQPQP
jgi:hypothetical protein